MPLGGTIAKAMPSLVSPIAAERFIALTAARKPKIVIAVASDTPIMPIVRCRATCPDAASQVWNAKYSDQAKNSMP
jgi:hypothetical protein